MLRRWTVCEDLCGSGVCARLHKMGVCAGTGVWGHESALRVLTPPGFGFFGVTGT